MRPTGSSRRLGVALVLAAGLLTLLFMSSLRQDSPPPPVPAGHAHGYGRLDDATLKGHVVASKLGNATAKAELGRAAWKVLHTTFARFPEKPSEDEKEALRSYVYLFQRLYPCGECAEHFGKVLAKYPPQVSSRSAAATWGCYVHNIVNRRLQKPEFDCANIGDAYDCGCGDDEGAKTQGELRD